MSEIPGYERFEFNADGRTKSVFWRGSGPGVLVMHELPGLTRETVAFAERVRERGYTVFLPLLFGRAGRESSVITGTPRICIRGEILCLARRTSSPVTVWLRALGREVHARCGGPGIGVVGMCLTGSFVLAMMADEHVLAPVASQPSLPFLFGDELGTSPADLEAAKGRARNGTPLMGLRFTGDKICPAARFRTLRREFGDAFDEVQIRSPDPEHDISRSAHSVLTFHFADAPTTRS
jgi:dienelactone hydrolase